MHVFGLLSIFCNVMLGEWFNFLVVDAVVMTQALISAVYLTCDIFWDVMCS
jgi:hypothetical protein